MLMERQFAHAQLPPSRGDDRARQDFVQTLKLYLATRVVPDVQRVYEESVAPAFARRHGRPPADKHEVADLMEGEHHYRMWGALYRTAQELIWNSVAGPAIREGEALAARADVANPKGSLRLDPALETPRYLAAVDIHCMPGGYAGERFAGDVLPGALYDRGVHIYGMGGLGPHTDKLGVITSRYLRDRFPDLEVRRILDLGCSVGHSTLPYAEVFPGAEIHAVEVAGPMLRYAHARAEALGVPVHFAQANAEELDYPDGHFDLVVSHILLHETSNKAIRRILKESRRVARRGGVVAHIDMCPDEGLSPFDAFMMMFDGTKNNEPFWTTFRAMDGAALMAEAGFADDAIFVERVSRAYSGQAVFKPGQADGGRGSWQMIGGVK